MNVGRVSSLSTKKDWVDPKVFECKRKTAYPLKSMAERDAAVATKQAGKLISAYHCRFCDKYHIGNDASNNVAPKEPHMSHKFFFDYDGLTLAKIKDDYNQYVFAIPPNTAENDQAVLERGFLIAYKKGADIYRDLNGNRSEEHKIFFHIFPFYPKELVRFKEKIEQHEEMMVDINKIKMDFLNGLLPPSLTERIARAQTPPQIPIAKLADIVAQQKIAEQEMHGGRAVFRNADGLKPHHRDIFTCCNDNCNEKIELRAYISVDAQGTLTSVGSRVAVDSNAIRKAGSSKQKPSWICGKCVARMSGIPAETLAATPAAAAGAVGAGGVGAVTVKTDDQMTIQMHRVPQFKYNSEVVGKKMLGDLEEITMNPEFDDKFVRGAMMMVFKIMKGNA